jgi:hypothetical protein
MTVETADAVRERARRDAVQQKAALDALTQHFFDPLKDELASVRKDLAAVAKIAERREIHHTAPQTINLPPLHSSVVNEIDGNVIGEAIAKELAELRAAVRELAQAALATPAPIVEGATVNVPPAMVEVNVPQPAVTMQPANLGPILSAVTLLEKSMLKMSADIYAGLELLAKSQEKLAAALERPPRWIIDHGDDTQSVLRPG